MATRTATAMGAHDRFPRLAAHADAKFSYRDEFARECRDALREIDALTEALRRHVMDWGHCGHEGACACSHAAAHRLLAERGESLMTDYQDVTDCPICPQLATDRDDALREAEALRAELEGKSAALHVLASERRSCTPAERKLIDAYLAVHQTSTTDDGYWDAEQRLNDLADAVLAERGEA